MSKNNISDELIIETSACIANKVSKEESEAKGCVVFTINSIELPT